MIIIRASNISIIKNLLALFEIIRLFQNRTRYNTNEYNWGKTGAGTVLGVDPPPPNNQEQKMSYLTYKYVTNKKKGNKLLIR